MYEPVSWGRLGKKRTRALAPVSAFVKFADRRDKSRVRFGHVEEGAKQGAYFRIFNAMLMQITQ